MGARVWFCQNQGFRRPVALQIATRGVQGGRQCHLLSGGNLGQQESGAMCRCRRKHLCEMCTNPECQPSMEKGKPAAARHFAHACPKLHQRLREYKIRKDVEELSTAASETC